MASRRPWHSFTRTDSRRSSHQDVLRSFGAHLEHCHRNVGARRFQNLDRASPGSASIEVVAGWIDLLRRCWSDADPGQAARSHE